MLDTIGSIIMGGGLILLILVVIGFVMFITLASYYRKCKPNELLVIYGKTRGNKAAKCVHGQAAFVVPFFQSWETLSMEPMSIEIGLSGALSQEKIRINVPSMFTVAISKDEELQQNAAVRLLGLSHDDIESQAGEIIIGQLRGVIADMEIEKINSDRDNFLEAVQKQVESELNKIGLTIINVNIQDINDESGYIEALGKEAAARVTQKALVDVASRERDGATGVAAADREKRIKVAEAQAAAEIGEKEANRGQRIKVAEAEADAVKGEATAQAEQAEAEAKLKIAKAKADQSTYEADKAKEEARKDRDIATKIANTVPEAEAAKKKAIIDAEAEKEKAKLKGEGEGLEILERMKGEAQGIKEILQARAEGLKQVVEACGGDPDKAFLMMLSDKLPELMKINAEAVKGIKIDKIVAIGGGDSKTGVAGLGKDLMSMLPGLLEGMDAAGVTLPSLFGKLDGDKSVIDSEPVPGDKAADGGKSFPSGKRIAS